MDRSTEDFSVLVANLLCRSAHVAAVELRGSRARGTAGRFSDWDFVVSTDDFPALADLLPELVRPLDPLVKQWDRLSDTECYMLIVAGPTKIDLIFEDVPHVHKPPWIVDAQTVPAVDDHFWDWILWLASKLDAGKQAMVAEELVKMHEHILVPMGVATAPETLHEAIDRYLVAREECERRLGVLIDRRVGDDVQRLLAGRDM